MVTQTEIDNFMSLQTIPDNISFVVRREYWIDVIVDNKVIKTVTQKVAAKAAALNINNCK